MLFEKKRAEFAVLGGHLVYPGHPISVAMMITCAFPNYDAASRAGEFGWPEALSSGMVGGAGGAVRNGLEVLRQLRAGHDPIEVAQLSKRAWEGEVRPKEQTLAGQIQADGVLDALVSRVATWDDDAGSAATA